MRGLANKGVLITGATSGIGLATAHRFLEEGARVFINGRDGPRLEAALRSLEAAGSVAGAVADVRHEADVERLVAAAEAWLGRIEVLINNAGIGRPAGLPVDLGRELGRDAEREFPRHVPRRPGGRPADGRGRSPRRDRQHVVDQRAGRRARARTLRRLEGRASPCSRRRWHLSSGATGSGSMRSVRGSSAPRSPRSNDDEAFFAHYASDLIPLGRVGNADEVAAAYAFLALGRGHVRPRRVPGRRRGPDRRLRPGHGGG